MFNIFNKNLLHIIFLLSLIILISAYFIEFILGYEPCKLCLIQRIPYYFILAFSLIFIFLKKNEKFFIKSIFVFFIIGLIVSVYHVGIEQNIFNESLVCLNLLDSSSSTEDLLKNLQINNKSCKDVDFKIFGISLATINLLISLSMAIILFKKIKHETNK